MKKKQNNHGLYNVTIIYDAPNKAEASVGEVTNKGGFKEDAGALPIWWKTALLCVALVLLGIGVAFPWLTGKKDIIFNNEPEAAHAPKNPFLELSLDAEAALVFDVKKGKILYAKNEEAQLPLASLTKLMTALISAETLPEKEIVALGKDAIAEEGDSGLLVGERWRKEDLIALTLLSSSNDGAHALASAAEAFQKKNEIRATSTDELLSFTDMMTARAWKLGLNQTYFLNAVGLDIERGEGGAYGSARDVARLLEYILRNRPEIFDATQYKEKLFTSLDGKEHLLKNTNGHTDSIPGLVASKTGFTDIAGGNLAILFEAGPMYPLAVVVLGSSTDGRFSDVEQLVWATLQYLNLESVI